MASPTDNLRGIVFMVLATLFFSSNDAFMKLAMAGLPAFEVLFLRGVMASIWALPVVFITGTGPALGRIADRWITLRSLCELAGVLCWVVALSHMPIADATALQQVAPMLLLIGVAVIYRDRIGPLRMGLIAIGFIGALCVAQPGSNGVSGYALLALGCALWTAARDIVVRKVDPGIPPLVATYSTLVVVMAGGGIASLLAEHWINPSLPQLGLLACSGLLLSLGHYFIFLSYRTGSAAAVAPFYYGFSIWSVLSGVLVFGDLPNWLALAGIALIAVSGVAVVLVDAKRRVPVPQDIPIA